MKVIRNNKIYVEIVDILHLGILPGVVLNELKESYDYKESIVAFQNEESINYFKQRDDIIDYDYVSSLPNKAFNNVINTIYNKMSDSAKEYLDASVQHRKALNMNKEKQEKVKALKYQYETLLKYKKEKEEYDKLFSSIIDYNKGCMTCKNGSCRVEYDEKIGLDTDGFPQGYHCFGYTPSKSEKQLSKTK